MVLQQQRSNAQMLLSATRRSVVQRRPAGLVDICIASDQLAHRFHIALDGRHHQRAFVLRVARFHLRVARGQQSVECFVGLLFQGNDQTHLPFGIACVGIEPPAQQGGDGGRVVAQNGREKIFVRACPSQRAGYCGPRGQQHVATMDHGVTPLNSVSKLRLVACPTSSTAMPLHCATCWAT